MDGWIKLARNTVGNQWIILILAVFTLKVAPLLINKFTNDKVVTFAIIGLLLLGFWKAWDAA